LIRLFIAALAVAIVAASTPSQAQQPRQSQAGTLTCRLAPSVGLILGSRQRMSCEFVPIGRGYRERYSGTVTRFGIDLGVTAGGVMIWSVWARSRGIRRGALAGHYVGASGDIALGVGVGANALIGGSRRSVMLQPLSVSGQVGINLALGVAGLTLRKR
jgi:hypothetical protein